jgi:hypothetical protein
MRNSPSCSAVAFFATNRESDRLPRRLGPRRLRDRRPQLGFEGALELEARADQGRLPFPLGRDAGERAVMQAVEHEQAQLHVVVVDDGVGGGERRAHGLGEARVDGRDFGAVCQHGHELVAQRAAGGHGEGGRRFG